MRSFTGGWYHARVGPIPSPPLTAPRAAGRVTPATRCDACDADRAHPAIDGGGTTGQVEALRLGIARALVKIDPEHKPKLKAEDLMTRNPREVERKKFGRKKARKRYQFSKR